jgi:hypothetical protein
VAAPTYQAIGTFVANNSTPASVPWPAHVADDIGLLILENANQAATVSGWTEVGASPKGVGSAGSSSATGLQLFWKRAASGAEANASAAYTGNHQMGQILTVRGAWTGGDPIDTSAGDSTGSAGTAIVIPGSSTITPDCLIVAVCSTGRDAASTTEFANWANANLGSITERIDKLDTTANGGGFGVATGPFTGPGAYGNTTADLANSFDQSHISVAIRSTNPKSLGVTRRIRSLAAADFGAVLDYDSWGGVWR